MNVIVDVFREIKLIIKLVIIGDSSLEFKLIFLIIEFIFVKIFGK